MLNKSIIFQFSGYIGVGICATTVHMTILYLLVEKLFIPPIAASSIGFLAGAITGFLLNGYFVFKGKASAATNKNIRYTAFIKYCLMAGIGAILNSCLLAFMLYCFMLNYLYAQLLATACIVILNFICCKLWIFKSCPKKH